MATPLDPNDLINLEELFMAGRRILSASANMHSTFVKVDISSTYLDFRDLPATGKKSVIGILSQLRHWKFLVANSIESPNIEESFPYISNIAEKFPLTQ